MRDVLASLCLRAEFASDLSIDLCNNAALVGADIREAAPLKDVEESKPITSKVSVPGSTF
ncbi:MULTISPECIES: hypothetical protein [Vibrio]|uniref:hypothetical protein n=1 Tax=Vibrio TaxID=662 RepID=UPI000C81A6CD|nr:MULTISPECIES: hypothetical protein [unclassified Vibrio]CAK3787762.1 hypothetical protein VCRA2120E57_10284 [Vibrio crassostreae]PMI23211.1 hypothetical protein BCU50_07585 [Vibrio sp. 10N.286.46.E10]PMI86886.1 hypothetical protein BCU34_06830 [Vibrio sp. 10N.286.45.E10]PTO92163.1 hypothetical protein CWO08_19110 [Vibrio sp. 10N.286.48.B8]PTP02543.1 hypothetical protein CWO17_14340 [Vibrio sp. 10N.286.45.A3]